MTMNQSSANTLRTVPELAEAAGIARQTAYDWLNAGIYNNQYFVGSTPVFTHDGFKEALQSVKERKAALNDLRLPSSRSR